MRRVISTLRRAGAALLLLLAGCAPAPAQAPIAEQWRAVGVVSEPVSFGAEQVGRLRWRGGVELRSAVPIFGGLSGLQVLEDGRFVAISDNGDWFEGRLTLSESGDLVGVSDVRTAFMRDERAEMFANKKAGDSEALAQLNDGRFAVAFEQTQSVRIYDLNRDGPFGAAVAGPALAGVERLPGNVGLEALAVTREGDLLVGAEGGGRSTTPLWRARLGAAEPAPPLISYRPARGFSLTSLDRLPDGDFVALERFFSPVLGARARLTRIPAASLDAGGQELSGVEELAVLAPPLAVDNFEGVAAVGMADGAVRLYIVSDNNFSERQRTLLLAFDIVASAWAN